MNIWKLVQDIVHYVKFLSEQLGISMKLIIYSTLRFWREYKRDNCGYNKKMILENNVKPIVDKWT